MSSKDLVTMWESGIYSTDKGSCGRHTIWKNAETCLRCGISGNCGHHYLEFYDMLFYKRALQVKRVLEIGVYYGGSLLLWSDYFPNATIIGIDIVPINPDVRKSLEGRNVLLLEADARNADIAKSIPDTIDIVVDDGSHTLGDQKKAMEILWPLLSSGGLYCIEDINPENTQELYDYMCAYEPDALFTSNTTTRGGYKNSYIYAAKKAVRETGA